MRTISPRSTRVVALLVTSLVLLPGIPATAQTATVVTSERLAPGLRHETFTVRLSDGNVARGNLVRWRETNRDVQLRPHLARGRAAGLDTMPNMAATELRKGAVAGINGGYFTRRPFGTPNGPYVDRGRVIAGASAGATGARMDPSRGTVGIRTNGGVLLDRLHVDVTLGLPGTTKPRSLRVDEIDRRLRCPAAGSVTCPEQGEVALYDGMFGAPVAVPAGATVVTLERARIPSTGTTTARVAAVRRPRSATQYDVPTGQILLVAHGPVRGPRTAELVVGDRVTVTTALRPAGAPGSSWDDLEYAVPGAPLLLRGGRRQPALESSATTMVATEALGTSHRLGRHPRSAIARTAKGDVMLVTVDGRQPGWSVGLSLRELTIVLQSLDAVDAVNLDGGGPASMMVHGSFVNRVQQPDRGHANGLFLHVPQRQWFIRNSLSKGPTTRTFAFAFPEDRPLVCDWNGNGVDTPATFHNGRWVLSNSVDGSQRPVSFTYGRRGDMPVCGDWNGNGRDTIGVRRGDRWLLRNANSAGVANLDFRYGRATDTALVGDWNRNGRDTIGVRRGDRLLLRNVNSAGSASVDYRYGRADDLIVVGDFDKSRRDTVSLVR